MVGLQMNVPFFLQYEAESMLIFGENNLAMSGWKLDFFRRDIFQMVMMDGIRLV